MSCINECYVIYCLHVYKCICCLFVCLLSEVEEVASELVGRVLEKVLREERERHQQHSREGEVSLYIARREGGREERGRKLREREA